MRKFVLALAIAALLALPGITLGQPGGTYETTVLENSTGLSVIEIEVGDSILIDVLVSAPDAAGPWSSLDGAGFAITADKNAGGEATGDGDWIYDPTSPFTNSGLFAVADYLTGIGKSTTYDGAPLSAPYSAGVAEQWSTAVVPGPVPSSAGSLIATYEIHAVGASVGDTYLIFADDTPNHTYMGIGYVTYYGFYGGPWTGQNPLQVNITPEPATALLLLGVLPFLRRRR